MAVFRKATTAEVASWSPAHALREVMCERQRLETNARPAPALVELVEALVGNLRAAYATERALRTELLLTRARLLQEMRYNGTPIEEAA